MTPPRALLANRFEVEYLAARGGMSDVFRARDWRTMGRVALKLLHVEQIRSEEVERMQEEAILLSELRHPGIVSYIGHGLTEQGVPFLAMEWLEGYSLEQRLIIGPLSVFETLSLLRILSDALSVAHQRGIIHRDLKPSNIWLRDGQLSHATLIDFGIARYVVDSKRITRTGTLIGTPTYMAPEQVRGQRDLTPSTDIFSLGCLAFECLTGCVPFNAEHVSSVLAKILFEKAPSLRSRLDSMPQAVDALVEHMLTKDQLSRPQNAQALLKALDSLDIDGIASKRTDSSGTASVPVPQGLARSEQSLFSVVVAVPQKILLGDQPTWSAPIPESQSAQRKAWSASLSELGAHVEWMVDGSLIATFSKSESASDQAAQAARCALLIREYWTDAAVALATGRAVLEGSVPVGEVIERAFKLADRQARAEDSAGDRNGALVRHVAVDEVSAGLLDTRFVLLYRHRADGITQLCGERDRIDESRSVLGKPTPCLGREQELRQLQILFNGCVEEPGHNPRAVVLTGLPGVGKSRLWYEFLRRLRAQGREVELITGSGDPMRANSPYSLLGQALRRLCGAQAGEPVSVLRDRVLRELCSCLSDRDAEHVGAFLGEICGIHFPDSHGELLQAARLDPRIMSDQIRSAFLHWLAARCQQRPHILMFEDLHWGDLLSIHLLDSALQTLKAQPFMVLALARPDVLQQIPKLWEPNIYVMPLQGLSKKTSASLVKHILGPDVRPETVSRLVEQSAGNALFLEELVRAAAEGKGDALPETVLAMLQARLGRLQPSARLVLRAASVFGQTFWSTGILALCAPTIPANQIDECFELLEQHELIERNAESRFPGSTQYAFRHCLVQDAAYGLLTEQDRTLAHRLAARYLREVGEQDPRVLAEHVHIAGEKDSAIAYLVRAAEQSCDGDDLAGVILCAERAIAWGAIGEPLGHLRALQCFVYFWCGALATAFPLGIEALSLLPSGSERWCRTIAYLFNIAGLLGQPARLVKLLTLFDEVHPGAEALASYIEAASWLVMVLSMFGLRDSAQQFIRRIEQASAGLSDTEAKLQGWVYFGYSWPSHLLVFAPHRLLQLLTRSSQAFKKSGDLRNYCYVQSLVGTSEADCGDPAGGVQTLRTNLALARQLGETFLIAMAQICLAMVLTETEEIQESRDLARSVSEIMSLTPMFLGMAHTVLARLALADGSLEVAETEARQALRLLQGLRAYRPPAFTALILALIRQRRDREALKVAADATETLRAMGGAGSSEIALRLAIAEAHYASGAQANANEAVREACQKLLQEADLIGDPALRDQFLHSLPRYRRTLTLMQQWSQPDARRDHQEA